MVAVFPTVCYNMLKTGESEPYAMLKYAFFNVYTKFKLHFYRTVFSQFQNREKAMHILASMLYDQEQQRISEEYGDQRRSQVGSGMRNERIRTYNFPQGRLTEHRIGLTIYKLDAVMDGDLDEIIDGLITADRAQRLKQGEG